MKRILTVMALFIAQFVAAQHYDAQLNKAGEALQKKDFCTALTAFKEAFKEKDRIGTYDLAYASVAAANCNDETQALAWLSESQRKGLGLNPGEADAIANDSAFVKLRQYPEWASFVSGMRRAFDEKQAMAKKRSEEWLAAINANRVAAAQKGEYAKCKPGFALYFSKKDSVDVPYLVYVPKTYDPAKPTTTIVYLHGGVLNTEKSSRKCFAP